MRDTEHVSNPSYFHFMQMGKWRIMSRKWILAAVTHNSGSETHAGRCCPARSLQRLWQPASAHHCLRSGNRHCPLELLRPFKQSSGFPFSQHRGTGQRGCKHLCKPQPSVAGAWMRFNLLVCYRCNTQLSCVHIYPLMSPHIWPYFSMSLEYISLIPPKLIFSINAKRKSNTRK